MAHLINLGNEMLRINTEKNRIEYSKNGGNSWHSRFTGNIAGTFYDLCIYGDEILACTSKGVYYSKNEGLGWHSRYTGTSCGTFEEINAEGSELLATTSKGLYYSKNGGLGWHRK